MNRAELARLIDHSVLQPEATEADIRAGVEIVRAWNIGFYCVQPCWVRAAAAALEGTNARVVTVAGFPHGLHRCLNGYGAVLDQDCALSHRHSVARTRAGGNRKTRKKPRSFPRSFDTAGAPWLSGLVFI